MIPVYLYIGRWVFQRKERAPEGTLSSYYL